MKNILVALIALLTTVIVIIFIAPLFFNGDKLKRTVETQILQNTGVKLTLKGDVSLKFFPDIAINANNVSVQKGLEEAGIKALNINQLRASVRLLSLFSDKIIINEVSLIDPVIQQAKAKGAVVKTKAAYTNRAQGDTSNEQLLKKLESLSIEKLSLQNASFIDAQETNFIKKANLNLTLEDINKPLIGSISLIHKERAYSGLIELKTIAAFLKGEKAALKAHISSPKPFYAQSQTLTLTGNIIFKKSQLSLNQGALGADGLKAQIDIVANITQKPDIQGKITIDRLDSADFIASHPQLKAKNRKADKKTNPKVTPPKEQDLSALSAIDAQLNIKIKEFLVQDIILENVNIKAALKDNIAQINLAPFQIASGTLGFNARTNIQEQGPIIFGKIQAQNLQVSSLTKLARQPAFPFDARLSSDLEYGFIGLDSDQIKENANLRGSIKISQGYYAKQNISDFESSLSFEAIDQPVNIKGRVNWQQQPFTFNIKTKPIDFFNQPSAFAEAIISQKSTTVKFYGNVAKEGSLNGQLRVNTASVKELLNLVDIKRNVEVPLTLNASIKADHQNIDLQQIDLTLDQMSLSGKASLGLGHRMQMEADLATPLLDLGLLSIMSSGNKESSAQTKTNQNIDTPLDSSALRSIQADIKLAANSIKIGGAKTGATLMKVSIDKAIANASLTPFSLYEGQAALSARIDGSKQATDLSFSMEATNVNAQPFLSDAVGFDRITGRLNTNADITGRGTTQKALTQSLQGQASLSLKDGRLRGVDIAKLYNNLGAILSSGGVGATNENDSTQFTELGADFIINQGIARSQNIKMTGPFIRMQGKGDISLVEQSLEIKLNPKLVASSKGQGGQMQDVSGIGIPIRIAGPWQSPQITPDLSAMLANPQKTLQNLKRLGLPIEALSQKLGLERIFPENKGGQQPQNLKQGAQDALRNVLQGQKPADAIGKTLNKFLGGAHSQTPNSPSAPNVPQQKTQPQSIIPQKNNKGIDQQETISQPSLTKPLGSGLIN